MARGATARELERLRRRCGRVARCRSAGTAATGGYLRTPGRATDADAARVVRRRGGRPRAGRRRATGQRQPVGLVGLTRTRDGPRRASPARTSTRCPTAARTTVRSAWSSRASPRSTRCADAGSARPGRSAVALLRRGGGRPVRRGLRRVAAADRRARRRTAARALTDARRHDAGRGDARRRPRPGRARPRPDAAPGRRVRRAARRAGPRAGRSTAPVGVASAIWPHGRWRFDLPARPTTPAPPGWPTGTTRCSTFAAHRARRPRGRRAGRRLATVRQGRASSPNGTNAIPSRVHGLAGRPRRRPAPTAVRAVVADVAGAVATVHGGTVDQESWTDRTALRRRRWPAGSPRCSAARRVLLDRRRPRRRASWPPPVSDGDAVRAQPDRRLALPRRARRPTPTAWPASTALATRAAELAC